MVCLLTISFFSKCQKWGDYEVSYFSHTHAEQPFIQAFYEPTFPNHWILRLGTLVAALCSYKINQHTSGHIWYLTCVHSDTWLGFFFVSYATLMCKEMYYKGICMTICMKSVNTVDPCQYQKIAQTRAWVWWKECSGNLFNYKLLLFFAVPSLLG